MNAISTWEAIRLVAGRELAVRLRDKAFLVGSLITLLIVAGLIVGPALFADDPPTVAVSAQAGAAPAPDAGLTVRSVATDRAAEELVRSEKAEAAVVSGGGARGVKVIALAKVPDEVVRAFSTVPPTELLEPSAISPGLRALAAMAFAVIFLVTMLASGIQIAQSVTEEKQTRIVEILVAAVPVRALLAGKIAAHFLLAVVQVVLMGLVAVVGMRATGNGELLDLIAGAIGWFIPFYLAGFLLLASLFAAAGALVTRQEDLAGALMPLQLIAQAPFFGVIFLQDNAVAMTILSYVPFSAPTAMPLRLFAGEAAAWEPVLTLVLLLATAGAAVLAGARLYEGALLRTNGRTSMAVAWRSREELPR